MKIIDFISKDNCVASLTSTDKEGALRELAACLAHSGATPDADIVFEAIIERENLGTTGVGEHVAIPHAKIKGLESLVAAFGKSEDGIEYSSVDNKPVLWVFMLLAPESVTGVHLKALARISKILRSGGFREGIRNASTSDDIMALIEQEDNKIN